jgi:hypothetical protein
VKRWLKDLFSESSDISSMRVMAMIALFASIGLAFTGHDSSALVFVGAAMGGKVSQKYIEVNGEKNTTAEGRNDET